MPGGALRTAAKMRSSEQFADEFFSEQAQGENQLGNSSLKSVIQAAQPSSTTPQCFRRNEDIRDRSFPKSIARKSQPLSDCVGLQTIRDGPSIDE